MSLLVRLATGDGDILDLGVGADQFTVAINSQGKNPGKSPCEKSCCWLSNCYMLRLSRIRPRVVTDGSQVSHHWYAAVVSSAAYSHCGDRSQGHDKAPLVIDRFAVEQRGCICLRFNLIHGT